MQKSLITSLALGCCFVACSDRDHAAVEQQLALKQIVAEGSSIGATVDDLRTERGLPVEVTLFAERFDALFRYGFQLDTSEVGTIEFSRNGRSAWVIQCMTGVVRKSGHEGSAGNAEFQVLADIDFSKPLSMTNLASLDTWLASNLVAESKSIWLYYSSGK